MKKVMILIVLALAALAGCKKNTATDAVSTHSKIMVTHASGETEVTIKPSRVVILDFSSLDTMQKLGVESSVVAVPKKSLPEYLASFDDSKYEDIGGLKDFDFEKINSLTPDLIIISNRQISSYDELSKIAPTINTNLASDHYLDSYKDNTRILGRIWEADKQAEKIISQIETDIVGIAAITANDSRKALIVLYNAGKFSAYGSGSRFGIIHDEFGVKPVDDAIEVSTHGKSITSEYIANANPDILFIVDRNVVMTKKPSVKSEIENKLIKTTNAYKNNKIVYLPPDHWYLANGGTQSVELMIDDVKKALK